MLNLGCVWDREDYGPDAPAILFDMILRNLPEGTEGDFTCFTDFQDDLGPRIKKRSLRADKDGIQLFPLNCVIIRKLDAMIEGKQAQSCFYDGSFPEEVSLVIFNDCRPQDCTNWVKHVWKIGGGTSADLEFVSNATKERLADNIRYAFRKATEWFEPELPHDDIALIIGGGPSLNGEMGLLKMLSQHGATFAVNGVPGHIYKHDIRTDFHVMLDPHPYCENFVMPGYPVTRYYASQCDQSVILAAQKTGSLVCWHGGGEATNDLAKQGYAFLNVIGGGTTAASRALVLAYGLGYRTFHLFGMDSSYDDGLAHAYEQPFREATLDVTCGDEVFRTTPQLLGQAEDFKLILPDLIRAACQVTVHGDGLLKAIATQMAA